VIFIDDLERCRPARAVEVFQVAAQLLAHEGVATVLLADMRAIARAAELASVAEGHEPSSGLGRRYMEKLIQLELELPTPDPDDMRRLLRGEPPPGSGASLVAGAAPAAAAVRHSIRSRLLDLIERAGWIPFAAAIAVSAIVTTTFPSAIDNETASTVFGLIIWLTIGIGVAARRRRRRRRRQRLEVEQNVEAALEQIGDQPAAADGDALERSLAEAAEAGMRQPSRPPRAT
jgi:hypothetical protein